MAYPFFLRYEVENYCPCERFATSLNAMQRLSTVCMQNDCLARPILSQTSLAFEPKHVWRFRCNGTAIAMKQLFVHLRNLLRKTETILLWSIPFKRRVRAFSFFLELAATRRRQQRQFCLRTLRRRFASPTFRRAFSFGNCAIERVRQC